MKLLTLFLLLFAAIVTPLAVAETDFDNPDGTSLSPATCRTNSHCERKNQGNWCYRHKCRNSNCDRTEECPSHYYCHHKKCIQPTTRSAQFIDEPVDVIKDPIVPVIDDPVDIIKDPIVPVIGDPVDVIKDPIVESRSTDANADADVESDSYAASSALAGCWTSKDCKGEKSWCHERKCWNPKCTRDKQCPHNYFCKDGECTLNPDIYRALKTRDDEVANDSESMNDDPTDLENIPDIENIVYYDEDSEPQAEELQARDTPSSDSTVMYGKPCQRKSDCRRHWKCCKNQCIYTKLTAHPEGCPK